MPKIDVSKEEEKLLKQHRKQKETEEKDNMNKHKNKRRKKIQHTKLLLNIAMGAFVVIGLCSIYVNFKNGIGMDGIFSNVCDVIKWLIPTGCAKSLLETSWEKKMRLEYLAKGIEYDNN